METTEVLETPVIEAPVEVAGAAAEPTAPEAAAPMVIRQNDAILAAIESKLSSYSATINTNDIIKRVKTRILMQVSDQTRRDWLYGSPSFDRNVNSAIQAVIFNQVTEEWREQMVPKIEEAYLEELDSLPQIIETAIRDQMGSSNASKAIQKAILAVMERIEAADGEIAAMAAAPEVLQAALTQRIKTAFADVVANASPHLEEIERRLDRIESIERSRSAYGERIELEIVPANHENYRFQLHIRAAERMFEDAPGWSVEIHLRSFCSAWSDGPICHGIKASWEAMRYLTQEQAPGGWRDLDLTKYGNSFRTATHYKVITYLRKAIRCLPEAPILRIDSDLLDIRDFIHGQTRLGRHLLSHGFRHSYREQLVRLRERSVVTERPSIVGGPLT